MMKFVTLLIVLLTVFSHTVFAEIWDFGSGIILMPGRMNNYLPLQIEIGVSDLKGYGFAAAVQTAINNNDLLNDKDNDDKYYTKLQISSQSLFLFYRFEKFVHRLDTGFMYNRNQYIPKITYKDDKEENFQISSIIVLYTGPYVQYSNTVTGYETGDIYYGLRLFALTTSDVNSTSYNMINDDDAYVQEQNKKYGDFIKSNSPKSSIGLNLTVGWRFSG